MAIKSLTGSKKVATMYHHLVHCINNNGIEKLETEMIFNCSNANQFTPTGMSNEKSCSTGLAFDNYDRFTETLSEKDTLHDTAGIAYQTVSDTHF